MTLAYILNTYPQPSHSFIRREVQALERRGAKIVRIAMRRPEAVLTDPADRAEEARTEYVLEAGAGRLLASLLATAIRRPGAFWRALGLALRIGRRSRVGVLRHLIYLAEASHVDRRCAHLGVRHLHAHFGTNSTTVAMLAHALGGPRFSFTVHGPEEFDAPEALALPDKIARAEFTVAISAFGRSQLCRWSDPARWGSLKVVHCGIEPGKFDAALPLPDGPLGLVSIGRFNEQKGQMVLVEAMARLRETQPEAHLTLVGDGELRGALEAAIAEAGLGAAITLTGWLAEDAVIAALGAAHALVLPSFAEGLPMVVMEAMAARRPVIATYIAGIPELVQQGETGWLVPAGDVEALCAAIETAGATPLEKLARMGDAARSRVLARHDVDTEAGKLLALFTGAGADAG